ncbi:MAG TPA: hypothetical protein DD737_02985 [Ruminococcaceae bacterium]|jgi:uncharacterized protein (DUF427 family)|nr:hypothetical protein [Oscillospiraceae bacterium]
MADKILLSELSEPNQQWWIHTEPTHRWVRVKVGGETIADSRHVLLVIEAGRLPVYYFPKSDVRLDLLRASDHHTRSPHKGKASYWDIKVGDRIIKNAAWGYPDPDPESKALKGYLTFVWDKVDAWYEEKEQIFKHPRDPYSRVDAIPSSRHVRVVLNGQIVADSTRPVIVFETGLTPRYYLPKEDVHTEFLEPSDTVSRCPYKGVASYWTANVGGKKYKDIVWSYRKPLPEIPKISGLFSFYNESVDALYVDGEKWKLSERDRLPYRKIPTDYDGDDGAEQSCGCYVPGK